MWSTRCWPTGSRPARGGITPSGPTAPHSRLTLSAGSGESRLAVRPPRPGSLIFVSSPTLRRGAGPCTRSTTDTTDLTTGTESTERAHRKEEDTHHGDDDIVSR